MPRLRRYRYTHAFPDQPDWEPLERLAALTAERDDLPTIDPGDFMYMTRYQARGRPDLHLYKHYDTRRYLNIDDSGHTYVFDPTKYGPDSAWYIALPDLATAIDRLDLDGDELYGDVQ